jgi:hypothetical protein
MQARARYFAFAHTALRNRGRATTARGAGDILADEAMRERRNTVIGAAALTLAAALAAVAALWPSRRPPALEPPARADAPGAARITVTAITLGRAIALDKRVTAPSEVFAADDTVYASVVTEGEAERVQLTARFRRGQAVVADVSQGIAPKGTATSEFNIWKPGGLAPGDYTVEILVDGVAAGARPFVVRSAGAAD